jgi:23S rRNA (pseudouridine1915-N3)-methyltransferase
VRLLIAAVGRAKAGPWRDLERFYLDRLAWPVTVREVEEKRKLPPVQLKEREAELLLAALPAGATAVALDERGKPLSSLDFAARLGAWRDQGIADLAFLIGGADGLADQVRQKAQLVLSLGTMTWPHLLARGMLLEQLYRAQQILAGHPYHRG